MTRPEVSNHHRVTVQQPCCRCPGGGHAGRRCGGRLLGDRRRRSTAAPAPSARRCRAGAYGFPAARRDVQSFLPEGGMAPGSGYDFLLGQAPMPTASGGQPTPVTVGADGQPVAAAQSPTFLDLRQFKPLSQPISRWRDRVSNRSTATRPPLQTRRHLASLKTPRGRTASGIIRWASWPPISSVSRFRVPHRHRARTFRWVSVRASRIPQRCQLRPHHWRRRSFRHRPAEGQRGYRLA